MSVASRDNVAPLIGYLDRFSARPGEALQVKVSAVASGHYDWDVVRIWCGDPNPDGPGQIFEPVATMRGGRQAGRFQRIQLGSYARVEGCTPLHGPALTVSLLIEPWLPRAARSTLIEYAALDRAGWRLQCSEAGLHLTFRHSNGTEKELTLERRLERRHWYRAEFSFDRLSGAVGIFLIPLDLVRDGDWQAWQQVEMVIPDFAGGGLLTMAASEKDGSHYDHFNGRLEAPTIRAGWSPADPSLERIPLKSDSLLAAWDFSRAIDTQSIVDTSRFAINGSLVNVPTRAVRGSRWDGSSMCWKDAPDHYGAIHFHDDDLYDCGWETDMVLEIPAGTPSGVYGVRLRQNGNEDIVPFYILPPRGETSAKVCYLASTLTYQAYANYARHNCDAALRTRMAEWGAYPYNPDDYPIYAGSNYSVHSDGSGVAYSSRLRPILTMRPGFLALPDAKGSGLRHFPADSHLTQWLRQSDIDFDVVTDDDLDEEGLDLIRDYAVVLTAAHPEYQTAATLDALTAYTASGGNLAYLGGNGFYWKVTRTERLPGMLELRRGEGGIRTWDAQPGEYYHAMDGGYGGLWRRNGRPPQRLAGVGFTGQGLFEGTYYRRLDASYDADLAWMFDGIGDEKLGDFGLSGGGAAGFELDRADVTLGTPSSARILARSEGHQDHFITVPEEILTHLETVTGEPLQDLIRAEIVYFQTPGGGQVFSVGSITFCGSLLTDNADNNISRLLGNVVRRFSGGG